MNIYLLGYMGSGKSTLGKELALTLNYQFIDFDEYIVSQEAMTIPEIFKTKGEIYFRKKEAYFLNTLLSEDRTNTVVSLGGGTPCYGTNMEMITQSEVHTIYLNVPFKILSQRLWDHRGERPLVNNIKQYDALEDYVRKHLFERSYFYNKAQQNIKIKDQSPQEIIEEMIRKLF